MPTKIFSEAELHYEVSGLGPPVVLLHGVWENAFSWWQQVPMLARGHTVVNVDLPGFGKSRWLQEGPVDPRIGQRLRKEVAISPGIAERIGDERRKRDQREFARTVLELMDHLGLEVSVLIGHGVGGRIAMRLAVIAASRTAGVAVIDDTAGIPPKDPAAAGLVDAALLLLVDGGWKTNDTGGRYLATLGGRTFTERPDLHQLYAGMCHLNPPLDPGTLLSAAGPALADLAQVSVPTLFIAGDEDEVLPASVVSEASSRVPLASFELFEDTGHSPHFQHAERFNQLLAGFLGSVSQVGRSSL